MVGVRTSNRCDNCRKRKKKCGEQKPSCVECIRAGWVCPGYSKKTQWKFVDETPRLTEHYAGRKFVYDDIIDLDLEEVVYATPIDANDEGTEMDGEMMMWKTHLKPQLGSRYKIDQMHAFKLKVPRYHELNPLGSALVYCLESKVKGTLMPLSLVGSFFQFIPARLGHNAALDDAVACLCAIYCRAHSIPYYLHRGICRSYVRALSSLRSCLDDSSVRMESETLCASILLQMCELVVNVDRGKWSHLARGTAFLLQSRGVYRYTNSAFDHAMLESQLSYVLGQSMWFKEHCFLCLPEWQSLLWHSPVRWPFQMVRSRTLSLRSRLCGILVEVPSLIVHRSPIHENQICQPGWEQRSDQLMRKASTMLNSVKTWLEVEAQPLFLPAAQSKQFFQESIDYPDLVSGVLDCVANTALLTIDKILRSLYHAKLRSSSLDERSRQWLQTSQVLLDDTETIERWRHRAISAFEFVQGESELAAKPLDFGLRQIQSASPNCPIEVIPR